jgi:PAS domain S-box-containing protein
MPVLLMEPSLPTGLVLLQRVLALRDDLGSSWAARPLELVEFRRQPALLMEDPGGEFLDGLIGRLTEVPGFLRLAIGIATALGSLHGRGLVHKDVKPANLLVNAVTGEAWLTGFGLTSSLPRHRQAPEPPEVIAGTLAYMAPEQTGRMNRSVDARSDLYSLGVTFYEMLVGALPFAASNPMEWVHCHIARLPTPPKARVSEIPEPLSAIVMKLLAKAPEERYQTVAGVEADLRRCLAAWESFGEIEAFPLGLHDVPGQLLIPEKLYGREREIESLLAAFERVASEGVTELVLVSGYAGVGKSSVVNELHRSLVPSRGLFASGKFDQLKGDIPYATLAQAFQKLVRQILMQNNAEVTHWREALREALGPNGQLMVNLIPELQFIIGEQPSVAELPPQDAQNRFQMVFRRFLGVFARAEHPLALFLDDLQWLDSATLHLVKHLISHDDVRHVLLIGAYRDNEVNPSHPLLRTLAEISETGARVRQIAVAHLGSDDVARLVADALRCRPEEVQTLAQLVSEKTGGNPFFASQFIADLAEEGLLAFEPEAAAWRWDLARIRAKGYTDQVVELMVTKLSRLPEITQESLKQLACLGNSAGTATLSLIYGEGEEGLHTALREAVRLGLVFRSDDTYRFVHDRVQEAAYALIPDSERGAKHLRIGRLLSTRTAEEAMEEKVFEIVNQFNRGSSLIADGDEKAALVRLNILAGSRAKGAIAHSSADNYFGQAVALLPPDAWVRNYQQTFELYLAFSECEYLVGNFAAADALFDLILRQSASDLDRARVFSLRMRLYQVAGKYDDGVAVALDALRLFGVTFPQTDQDLQAAVATEFQDITVNLAGRAIGDLLDAPAATNPEVRAIINLLVEAAPCSYIGRPKLFPLITLKAVNSSLRSGNTDQSSFAYAVYAVMLVSVVGDIPSAFQFSEMSLRLNEKFDNSRLTGTLLHLHADHINFWRRPFATGLPILEQAFLACLEVGDLVYAGFLAFESVWQVIETGALLDEVLVLAAKSAAFARQSHNDPIYQTIRIEQQFVASLQGRTSAPFELDESGFDEAACLESIVKATFGCGIFFYHAMKQILAFLDGRHAEALDFAARAEPTLGAAMSMPIEATYHFFHALTLTALYPGMPSDQQLAAARTLEVKLQKLKLWADNCPENFANREALVRAEVARIEDRSLEAMQLYEQAIQSAREHGFAQNEGLANELAARFYTGRGFETIADTYLRKARSCYLRWGASGKVAQLDLTHPQLREKAPPPVAKATIGTKVEQLDLAMVVKTSQAVSGEIVLGKLIEKLMKIAVEHVGAGRGLLVLLRDDELRIEAEATTGRDDVEVTVRQMVVTSTELPESILNYVIRTRESVVLDDASDSNLYSEDAYVRRKRPRSVLCLPIVKQTKLVGALYLENNLTPRAFTSDRVAVLDLLASQAAISLENARLYAELEQENLERKQAEDELRRSEGLLAEGQRLSRTGSWAWNIKTGKLHWSAEQRRIFGIPPDAGDLTFADFVGTIHPEDRPLALKTVDDAIRVRGSFDHEFRIILPDGGITHIHGSGCPVVQGSGELEEYIGAVMDITEQYKVKADLEDALAKVRESEDRLRTIIDTIPGLVWGARADGSAEYINKRWLDYSGLSLEDAKGWGWVVSVHPEDIGMLSTRWMEIIASKKPGEVEARVKRFDGEYRWYLFRGAPLFDQRGNVVKWFGTNTDIEDRKRAEEALRRSKVYLEHAQKLSHTGSVGFRLSDGQIFWSEETSHIYGYDPALPPTMEMVLQRAHPEDVALLKEAFGRAAQGGASFDFEHRLLMPDGSIKHIRNFAESVRDEAGKEEVLGAITDITERKRAEEELRRSEAGLRKAQAELAYVTRVTTMGELAASIAHEVNQPIAGVVINANACLRWLDREKEESVNLREAREALQRIIRDGNRAGEVIARIRALFKKTESAKEPLDFNETIREVIVLARSEMDKQRVALRLKLPSGLPPVLGDRVQLQQVMLNLILNAIEAMAAVEGRSRDLVIQTQSREEGELLVTVRDSGIGLDSVSMEQAFTAFHTTKPAGLGMGLSISRSIVENHSGRLWVTTHDGPGASFHFTLPTASRAEP